MTLKAYMVRLATDVASLSEFMADPEGASERAGLSAEERAVLCSGDQNRIYQALAEGEWPPKRSR